jgi:RNA polymerase sigma factor (sigma-70 family)
VKSGEDPDPLCPESVFFRRLLSRDPAAAARVVAVARQVVAHRGYSIPASDRPDIIQDVLLDVWRALSRPDFRRGPDFDGFVRTVTYRRCVDWMRRKDTEQKLTADPRPQTVASADRELLTRELLDQGREVLRSLQESCRELMRLRIVEELPYRGIAERLGRTEGALCNHMYNCLKEAKRILGTIRRSRGTG